MSAPSRSPLPPAYEALEPEPRPPRRRPPRTPLRTALAVLGAVVLVVGAIGAWSVIGAASTRGNESFNAKWADWMRSHGMGSLISSFEAYYYNSHQPKKGGEPKGLNPVAKAQTAPTKVSVPAKPMLPAPAPVPLVVSPALPGEGQWQPIGPVVDGRAAMYEAQFRADTVFTSEITTAVWMDPLELRVSLVPGLTEPGGTWTHPPYVTPAEAPSVLAAFNGGFRFQDARGGFYLDGRTAVPLVTGAASLVIYKDGRVDVGTWGSEVSMTPDVQAVLQNLVPMVDQGQVSASATYHDSRVWGSTLSGSVVVARSGVGVTANGALVYVAGPALTAKTLAEALQRAGAVRAMTLDINPEWVTFNIFTHPYPATPTEVVGTKLYPQMQRSANRYLYPTQESRDFFEVSLIP
ncbi:MAG TPA: phosphodiester glycosidase family protein [Acidimicrobiales bacterium]|nr:phosphodiester glycosidase family protein [Acidimicrobiales bacterium]